MTTSLIQLKKALSDDGAIPQFWLGYFQEGFRAELHEKLIELAEKLKSEDGKNKAYIAKRIGKRPEQISRWLSSPTNLECDTVSDLALAMGYIPKVTFSHIGDEIVDHKVNYVHPAENFVVINCSNGIKPSPSPTGSISPSIMERGFP